MCARLAGLDFPWYTKHQRVLPAPN